MKIEKFKYGENDADVLLKHQITEENYGKYFKTLISRNGYKFRIIRSNNLKGISEENPVCIELHSPKGRKKVASSRGFRTYYKITCKSKSELEQVCFQLNI